MLTCRPDLLPRTPTGRRGFGHALAALALLLQVLWLPFHLATVPHLLPGEPLPAAVRTSPNLAAPDAGEASRCATEDGAPAERPHSVLDHQDPKHRRFESADLESDPSLQPAALAPFRIGADVPRAPPRRIAARERVPLAAAVRHAVAPRAPPTA
jgi:hypothetical protein